MTEQIKNAFGLDFHTEPVSDIKGIPFYMSNGRSFLRMEIFGIAFLLVCLSEDDKFGVVALEKQLVKYSEAVGLNVAYAFPCLTRVQRDALILRRIPFISLQDQMYLPFLGIALSNQFRKEKKIKVDKMTPASQMLFLYFLYKVKDGTVVKKQAAEVLGLTRTSITRASQQLAAMGLITEEAAGKEIRMKAVLSGKEFLEKAKPYLIRPVIRKVKAEQNKDFFALPAAGETALSLRSMLNAPAVPVKAILKQDPRVKALKEIDDRWGTGADFVQIELWKYDPVLFAKDQIVDPVSMMLSLQDVEDERVEGELKDYMEAIQW